MIFPARRVPDGRCEELFALGVEAIDKGVASLNSLEQLEAGVMGELGAMLGFVHADSSDSSRTLKILSTAKPAHVPGPACATRSRARVCWACSRER